MTTALIHAQNLTLAYQLASHWVNVLHDVSLDILPGEIHGLVGESGSGKSTLALTLLRYMASNARVISGQVIFDGVDLLTQSDSAMRRLWGKSFALVPQDPLAALNPAYPVGEQIAEVARQHLNLTRAQAAQQTLEALARVKIRDPKATANLYPHQLSGGMQQRVLIAMTLITQPRLLVLDEPTTALDVTTQASILDLFRDLIREQGASALYVSHDLSVIGQICDRVTVLYSGEVLATAPVHDLYQHPLHPYVHGLLNSLPRPMPNPSDRLPIIPGRMPALTERPTGCIFAPRCPLAQAICTREAPPLTILSPQQTVRCHRWGEIQAGLTPIWDAPRPPLPMPIIEATPVLAANALSKRFQRGAWWQKLFGAPVDLVAVNAVSAHINRHAVLGLVGESGSGKTTFARCIVGLEHADSGEITLLEKPLAPNLHARPIALQRDLQMVFQNPNDTLNPYRTVGDALRRTLQRLSPEQSSQQLTARVAELLTEVNLSPDYAARYPSQLSGGEKQRVALARAFAAHPALVVADEPTSSLDVSVQALILNLMKDLRQREGASYLFISHDLRAVAYLSDWLMVMYLGQVVEEGTVKQVYAAPSHPYTEALLASIPSTTPAPQPSSANLRLHNDTLTQSSYGCPFQNRCPRKIGTICEQTAPQWQTTPQGHRIRCHIPLNELTRLQSEGA